MINVSWQKYTTARAVASSSYFNKPKDFKGVVRYKADLIMDRKEAASLIEQCKKVLKDFVQVHNEAVANGKKKAKKLNLKQALLNVPFEDYKGDDSKVIVRVKRSAEIAGKPHRIFFYDSIPKLIDFPPMINDGSIVKVAGQILPHDGLGGGITLTIDAVQIIELVEGKEDNFGFREESGYVYKYS